MFIDTSVFVAILSDEDDADHWITQLESAPASVTSTLVVLEAVMRLTSKLGVRPDEAEKAIRALLDASSVTIEPIGEAELSLAVNAFARYGKGQGHAAKLNLADCLSYACARNRGLRLLYKGDDFGKTDLA